MSGQLRVTRRALVGGLGATGFVALSGCGASGSRDLTPRAHTSAEPPTSSAPATTQDGSDADISLAEAAIADERALLAYCSRAASQFPSSAGLYQLLAGQQRQHVAVLRAALTNAGPEHIGAVPGRHGDLHDTLLATASLLDRAQQRRRADAMAAESGLLARLFASISASHAVAAGLDGLRP